jgi:hypothetical protein
MVLESVIHIMYLYKNFIPYRRQDRGARPFDRICCCHFPSEDRNLLPTIFQRNANISQQFTFSSPKKKTRKRRRESNYLAENTNILNTAQPIDSDLRSEYNFSSTFHETEKYLLEKEIQNLKEEVRCLKVQNFGFFAIENNDKKCLFYTGLHVKVFKVLEELCSTIKFEYYDKKRVEKISLTDQILLTLIKLRLNLTYNDLGWRFGVSDTTAFRIVCTFLPVLHKIVYQSIMDEIPSRRKNSLSLPSVFSFHTSCRVVLDCTEMSCEAPKRMDHQRSTWSSYKHYNTLKVLLGVAPNAAVVYCSPAYPGCTADKEIVEHCGILKHLVAGDMILADKGFLISDIIPPGVSVNIPPFLSCPQFTPSEKVRTRSIAKARIHVERANARLKNFRIVDYFPTSLFIRASMIIQTCAGLINFQNPLLREIEQHFYTVTEDNDDDENES